MNHNCKNMCIYILYIYIISLPGGLTVGQAETINAREESNPSSSLFLLHEVTISFIIFIRFFVMSLVSTSSTNCGWVPWDGTKFCRPHSF